MTRDEFTNWMKDLSRWRGKSSYQRQGQWAMNHLPHQVGADITLNYPTLDCFYNDNVLADLISFLEPK